MKQSEMLALLKELRSDLQRYSVASDSIVPGAYVEALDAAIDQFEKYMWHDAKVNKPEDMKHVLIRDRWGAFVGFYAEMPMQRAITGLRMMTMCMYMIKTYCNGCIYLNCRRKKIHERTPDEYNIEAWEKENKI